MEKNKIKEILRESFVFPMKEEEKTHGSGYEKHYGELERKLDGTMLKASQVMAAAGLGNPNDATDRSLFSKKLRREKNEDGGVYQFDEEELASVMKVVNNPASYLNKKTK